jgi:hypothetical protein
MKFRGCPSGNESHVASRDTRREENQKRYRVGNEGLHDLVDGQLPETQPVPFLCECAAEDCDGRVEIRLSDWKRVAAQPRHYVMITGHPRSEGEAVVGSVQEYDVVLKPG